MLTKRIIPCLDVSEGRVVKGTNFVDLKDAGDPIELGKKYNNEGADELVFLDITASSDKRGILRNLVEKIAKTLFIPFTVGGGISDIETIEALLEAGADKVSINTAAIKNPNLIKEASNRFGNQCIVVALDAKEVASQKWKLFTHGGRNPTGIDLLDWTQKCESLGAGEFLLTSMDKDGTKSGYDLPQLQAVKNKTSIPLIASGGAGSLSHIKDVLEFTDAALLASLLHYGELSIEEIKKHCKSQNLPTRPS